VARIESIEKVVQAPPGPAGEAGLLAELAEREREAAGLRDSMAAASRQERRRAGQARRQEQRIEAVDLRAEDLEQRLAEAEAKIQALESVIRERNRELEAVGLRLTRLQSSLPVRVLRVLRRRPPLRWIAARRAEEYWRRLESDRSG
jgi:predicted RNase H-like nuclease (RuvC/YqgF family)